MMVFFFLLPIMKDFVKVKRTFQESYLKSGISDFESQQHHLEALADLYSRKYALHYQWQDAYKVSWFRQQFIKSLDVKFEKGLPISICFNCHTSWSHGTVLSSHIYTPNIHEFKELEFFMSQQKKRDATVKRGQKFSLQRDKILEIFKCLIDETQPIKFVDNLINYISMLRGSGCAALDIIRYSPVNFNLRLGCIHITNQSQMIWDFGYQIEDNIYPTT